MAINFLNSIDLNQNQLLNARVHVAGSAPSGSGEGSVWLDSSNDTLKFYVADTGGGSAGWISCLDNSTGATADTLFTIAATTTGTGTTVNSGDSITIAAGTGITTTGTSDGVITIANSAAAGNSWGAIAVSGQTTQSASSAADTVTYVGAGGMTITTSTDTITFTSANDNTTYTGGDGLTLTGTDFDVDAAQTLITSIYNANLKVGHSGSDAYISFDDDNEINLAINGSEELVLNASALYPAVDAGLDLGTADLEFKNAYFDGTVTSDAFAGPLTGDVTGDVSGSSGTCTGNAATATKISSITNSNIVQLASSQTLTNKTLTAPTLTTPALGTPSALVLTNATGLPAAQVAQGTMASGMVLVAPVLGTPASGTLTNCTFPTANINTDVDVSNANLLTKLAALESSGGATDQNITIGTDSGDTVVITGNLQVSGTTTTVNSTTVNLNDHNIVLDSGNSTSAVVNTAGITLEGGSGSDVTWMWLASEPAMELKVGAEYADAKFARVTSTGFIGDITGDVTGNTSGSSGTCTGNAATATALATARTIGGTSFDGTGNITPANATLAATATALATPRTIGGVSFDGTGNISLVSGSIPDNAADTSGTAATATLATTVTVTDNSGGTARPVVFHDESNALLDDTGTFTYTPNDGMVTATGFTGTLTGQASTVATIAGLAPNTATTQATQGAITSLGTLTTLTVDNVIVNGSTIGHTGDTDLMTVASGILTVAGEVSMTTLDIGGTNVSSTAAELNLLDGVTAVANSYAPVVLALAHATSGVVLASSTYTCTHDFGTRNVTVKVYETAGDYQEVFCEVQHDTTATVKIVFGTAPVEGAYTTHITRN